jgi:hypothetical protein
MIGVLRNIIPVDSPAGEAIEIKRITNETILPLVTSLLDVDLNGIAGRVEQLVNQVVSTLLGGHNCSTDNRHLRRARRQRPKLAKSTRTSLSTTARHLN